MRKHARLFAAITIASMFVAGTASAGEPIQIARDVPYLDPSTIRTNILNECDLGTRLGTSLEQFSTRYGVSTRVVDDLDPKAGGRVFEVRITNVLSRGNAFIGHQKSMSVQGELFVDGESKGVVNFTRDSSGGFGAGFKGSCSVLGRCANTLGNDLSKWLKERD